MTKCRKYQVDDLFKYIYDLVNKKEKAEIKMHIRQCSFCQKKIQKIKNMKQTLINTPQLEFNDDVNLIIDEACKREKKSIKDHVIDYIDRIQQNIRLRPVIVTSIAVLLIIGLMFLPGSKSRKFYITRVSGDVHVNNESFFNELKTGYSTQKSLSIKVLKGECVLQIRDDKLIIIKTNTDVLIKEQNEYQIELNKGKIICSVRKSKNAKKLSILAGSSRFHIVGTKFYVEKNKSRIRCSVKEGRVLSILQNKTNSITDNRSIIVMKGKAEFQDLQKEDMIFFQDLKNTDFIRNIDDAKKIVIQGTPHNSSVLRRYKFQGKTPFFIISEEKEPDLIVSRKGFIPYKISLGDKQKSNVDFKLKKIQKPLFVNKYKLSSSVFIRPIKFDDYLVIPSLDGYLYKFNLNDNRVVWEFKTKNRISTTPLYEKDKLYFASNDKYFYCLDFNTKELIWKRRIGILTYSIPVIHNNRIYLATTSGEIISLNKKNGEIVWKKCFKKGFYSSLIIDEEKLYVGDAKGFFYAIDINNRDIIWKYKTRARIIGCKPVIKDDLIYIGSSDKILYALNRETGDLVWKFNSGGPIMTSPLLFNDTIITVSTVGDIYALDPLKGNMKWHFQTSGVIIIDPVVLMNNYITLGDKNNYIYILDRNGLLYYKFNTPFNCYAVFNNQLIIFDKGKNLKDYQINFK